MTLQVPNRDPANEGRLDGTMREVLTSWLRDNVDGMLPAVVISYDDATNRAAVRPAVAVGRTDGTSQPRAQIASVPCLRIGAGGFFLRWPIKPGDKGWILAADRDVSVFLQTGGEHPPPSRAFHTFSSGLFVPDVFSGWATPAGAIDAVTLQSADGQASVEVHADKVRLALGSVSVELTSAGVAIVAPTVTHNGINIGDTHIHGGTQPGDGTTAQPVG